MIPAKSNCIVLTSDCNPRTNHVNAISPLIIEIAKAMVMDELWLIGLGVSITSGWSLVSIAPGCHWLIASKDPPVRSIASAANVFIASG